MLCTLVQRCLQLQARCMERRYFEEVQGKLEVAVEQSSLPLALMPDVQVCRTDLG